MITSNPVSTRLGRLHVGLAGSGPPAVLWHSLFIDSRSWGGLLDALARYRRVITIDGPGHGRSAPVDHDFTLDDCASAAAEVLDKLDITESVDWVGNAWGGHVGIALAANQPARLRSLTTIGTPVQGLRAVERWTKIVPLVMLYRMFGPKGPVTRALSDALLGSEAVAAEPDQAAVIIDSFRGADRTAMLHAMRSVMLNRRDLGDRLPGIGTATLMLAAAEDTMGWQLTDAAAAVARMPNGHAGAVRGSGHVSPLLLDADALEKAITQFWSSLPAR